MWRWFSFFTLYWIAFKFTFSLLRRIRNIHKFLSALHIFLSHVSLPVFPPSLTGTACRWTQKETVHHCHLSYFPLHVVAVFAFLPLHTACFFFFSMEVNSSMINRFTAKARKKVVVCDTLLITFPMAFARNFSGKKRISSETATTVCLCIC